MLGNGRLEALCFDGSKRLANVRKHQKLAGATIRSVVCVSSLALPYAKGDRPAHPMTRHQPADSLETQKQHALTTS